MPSGRAAKVTVSELGAEWLRNRTHLKASSWKSLEVAWRVHVEPAWGDRAIGDIRHSEVQAWIRRLAPPGQASRAATKVKRAHGVLAGILGTGVRDRRIASNPAPGVMLPAGKGQEAIVFGDGLTHLPRPHARNGWFMRAVGEAQAIDPTFPRITIHDLRHTAASRAVSAGANVKAVQRMLGHASAAMTLDTYADLCDDDLDAVSDRLDEVRTRRVSESPHRRVGFLWGVEPREKPRTAYFRGSEGVRLAEDGGFEPPRLLHQHAFQACAIGH
jgi:hypothetical protein